MRYVSRLPMVSIRMKLTGMERKHVPRLTALHHQSMALQYTHTNEQGAEAGLLADHILGEEQRVALDDGIAHPDPEKHAQQNHVCARLDDQLEALPERHVVERPRCDNISTYTHQAEQPYSCLP
jgi:hypothetical protein